MFTLKLTTDGIFAENESIRFSLSADPMNQLSDASYTEINEASLSMDKLAVTTSGTNGSDLILSSIPNPFRDNATVTYNLPESGKVSLDIYNMLGEKVNTLLDEVQSAGNQSIKIDSRMLPPGVYTLTLKLQTSSQELKRTIKIVCN